MSGQEKASPVVAMHVLQVQMVMVVVVDGTVTVMAVQEVAVSYLGFGTASWWFLARWVCQLAILDCLRTFYLVVVVEGGAPGDSWHGTLVDTEEMVVVYYAMFETVNREWLYLCYRLEWTRRPSTTVRKAYGGRRRCRWLIHDPSGVLSDSGSNRVLANGGRGGGSGSVSGGQGGMGRIRIEYCESKSGTTHTYRKYKKLKCYIALSRLALSQCTL